MSDVVVESAKDFWDLNSLTDFSQTTKDCKVCGKWITIRKLPCSLLNEVNKASTLDFLVKGIVKPQITKTQAEALPLDFAKEAIDQITKFSSVSQEEAEKN